LKAGVLFEYGNLGAYGRLRFAERLRGFRETFELANFEKSSQVFGEYIHRIFRY
jgi:hypothetical protein